MEGWRLVAVKEKEVQDDSQVFCLSTWMVLFMEEKFILGEASQADVRESVKVGDKEGYK